MFLKNGFPAYTTLVKSVVEQASKKAVVYVFTALVVHALSVPRCVNGIGPELLGQLLFLPKSLKKCSNCC